MLKKIENPMPTQKSKWLKKAQDGIVKGEMLDHTRLERGCSVQDVNRSQELYCNAYSQ